MALSSKKPSEIVTEIKELHNQKLTDLRDLHQDMYINIKWVFLGHQNIYYDRYSKKLTDLKPEPWKVNLMTNLLYPMVRRNVAKLAKRPIWDVLPATTEQEDINSALISTQVLRFYWMYLRMPKKFIKLLTWVFSTGQGFFKTGWDPDAGELIKFTPEQRAALVNVLGNRVPKEIRIGDPYVEIVSPFGIFWESGEELEESDWCMHVKFRSKEYIENRYKIETPRDESGLENYDLKLMSMLEPGMGQSQIKDKIAVYDYYCKSDDYNYVVTCDKVVYKGKMPINELPFIHFVETPIAGSEWGASTVTQNRSNQSQYNKVRSSVIENANLMAKQKWLAPYQSNVSTENFTDRPGEVIKYNFPFKPEQADLKPLPAYYERILSSCKQDMQDVGSSQAVTQAKAEPGIRSGRAVLALQDADDVILGPTLQLVDDGLSQLGRKLLKILAKNVTEERLIKISGEHRELEVMSFTGSALLGPNEGQPGVDYYDVRVGTYSTYPMSRIGMEERVDRLIQMGVLNPQVHGERILHMLGSGDVDIAFDDTQTDRSIAANENHQLMQGQPLTVSPLDNHKIHIEAHDKFFKDKIRKLPPQAVEILLKHRQEHKMMQAKELIEFQMYTQGMLPGAQNAGPNGQQRSGSQAARAR